MEQVLVFAFRAGYSLVPDPNFATRQGASQGTTQALPAAPVATVRTVQPLTMAAPAPMAQARPVQAAAPLMLAMAPAAPLMLGAGEPAKRGPGRPKGSKNKAQAVAQAVAPIAQAVKVAPAGMMPARPAGVVPSKPSAPQGAWSGVFLNMGAPMMQGTPQAVAHPPLSMGPATSAALAETGEATDDELLALLG